MNRPTLVLTLTLLVPSSGCDLEDTLGLDREATLLDEGPGADRRSDRPHEPPAELLLRTAVSVGDLYEEPAMQEALAQRHDTHEDARRAHEALRGALAVAVADETVEAGAFEEEIAALEDAVARQGEALQQALDTAHGLLDPLERTDVVDMLPLPPEGAPEGGPPPGDRSGPPPRGPGAMLEPLELDDAQRQALREALGEPTPPERPPPLDLASFADEDFTAAHLGLAAIHQQHARQRAEQEVQLLAVLVPLLDEAQRATLVEHLSEAPDPTRAPR